MVILFVHIVLVVAFCVFRWLFKRKLDEIKREYQGEHVFMTEISVDGIFLPLIICSLVPCVVMENTLMWFLFFLVIAVWELYSLSNCMENYPLLIFFMDTDEVMVITCSSRDKYKNEDLIRKRYVKQGSRRAYYCIGLYHRGIRICEWPEGGLYTNNDKLLKHLERIPQE